MSIEGLKEGEISIYSLSGNQVIEADHNVEKLNIQHLESGVYWVKINSMGIVSYQKLLIHK